MNTETTMVILVCPVCASPLDAEVHVLPQELECGCCGQTWEMLVDADRNARHSLT